VGFPLGNGRQGRQRWRSTLDPVASGGSAVAAGGPRRPSLGSPTPRSPLGLDDGEPQAAFPLPGPRLTKGERATNQCAVSHQPKRVVTRPAQKMMPSAASEVAASRDPCELGMQRHGSDNGSRNHCDLGFAGLAVDVANWEVTQRSVQGAAESGRLFGRRRHEAGDGGARQRTPRALPRVSGLSTAPTTRPSTICPAPQPAPTTQADRRRY
jgi:hypothetical protein